MLSFWLHWTFTAVGGFSLVAKSGDYPLVAVCGLFLLWGMGSRAQFPWLWCSLVALRDMESSPPRGRNPRPLHWQAGSHPLDHQGSPPQPHSD